MNLLFNKCDGFGEFINVFNVEYDVGEIEDVFGCVFFKWELFNDFCMVLIVDVNNGDGGLCFYIVLIDEVGLDCYFGG